MCRSVHAGKRVSDFFFFFFLDDFQVICFVQVPQELKCLCLSVSLQRVWVERSGAARGDPDVTAPVPVSAVQRCSLPTASLLRRQQDQSRGSCVSVRVFKISSMEKGIITT